jgi:predicted GNAT superfamily acetyltransferase
VDAVAAQSLSEARRWRAATRSAFAAWLGAGYAVAGFMREADVAGGRCFYVLARDAAAADGSC